MVLRKPAYLATYDSGDNELLLSNFPVVAN
jgi:hypothetical protein